MRILIVGAYGLLGSYVTARLLRDGHDVVGAGRDIAAAQRRFPAAAWLRADLTAMSVVDWSPLLTGIHAVVNCAGARQDSPRDNLVAVHELGVATLAQACAIAGIRRFVQISAVGVDSGPGPFASTKRSADDTLRASELDWVILRPGLVLAPAAFGGSGLLRGLAGFPGFIPAVHADSLIQTVSVDDVAEAVSRAVRLERQARISCDLVADEAVRLGDLLIALRAWLGFAPAPVISAPRILGRLASGVADELARLGWRSPMRSAALRQLAAGVRGAASEAQQHFDFTPADLTATLAARPSGVQERWYARLYFLKPLSLTVLALFWAESGLIGLEQQDAAARLLTAAGFNPSLASAFVVAGSLADLTLGALVCVRRTAPFALKGMVALTAAYLVGASIWLPSLWTDPLGPLLKSAVGALVALLALAMMDER